MTEEKNSPLEIRSARWYREPLDYKEIIYESNHETHVVKITLNRPEKMNAMTHQLRAELFHALKFSELDNDINPTWAPSMSIPAGSPTGPGTSYSSGGKSGSCPR